MEGIVNFDKNNLLGSSFDVTIKPSTIFTDNEKRDHHLKGHDFFDVQNHLSIKFVSSSINKTDSSYVTTGMMTICGVSKEVSIPFDINTENEQTTFEGNIEINRFDFNLATEEYKGTFMVGETATVKIICVLD